jgi:hypothetical protein
MGSAGQQQQGSGSTLAVQEASKGQLNAAGNPLRHLFAISFLHLSCSSSHSLTHLV